MSLMHIRRLFHVLVLLPLSSAAGRKKLNGIHRFLSEGKDWDIELIRNDNDFMDCWEQLKEKSPTYDGILVSTSNLSLISNISETFNKPCAFIAYPHDKVLNSNPFTVFIIDNEKTIAHAAIGHFTIQSHPKAIAYVPSRIRTVWSQRRQEALATELSLRNRTLQVFGGTDESNEDLANWIMSLPKPAGIITAYDDRGRDVIEACRIANIPVPKQISVLGIGNDEPVCDMMTPKLTSIHVDFETQGYRAARELQAMMLRKRKPQQRIFLCGIKDIAIRKSTSAAKSDSISTRAIDFIDNHFSEGITPEDVVKHLNISRSLAYLRFKQTLGITILDAILSKRLGEVKRLLETTDKPISEIATICGYQDANYLKNQFKKRFHTSMRDWRKTHQGHTGTPPSI